MPSVINVTLPLLINAGVQNDVNVIETPTCILYVMLFSIKPLSHCPGVRPGASRQFVAGGPGRTGTNREEIRVRSYIPGSATEQIRFGAKRDHGLSWLCYGLRKFITDVAPEALRCVPVRPDTPRPAPGIGDRAPASLRQVPEVRRQSPGAAW